MISFNQSKIWISISTCALKANIILILVLFIFGIINFSYANSISKDDIFDKQIDIEYKILAKHVDIKPQIYLKKNMLLYEAYDESFRRYYLPSYSSYLLYLDSLKSIDLDGKGALNPKFSPDGKLIAYGKIRKPNHLFPIDVKIMNLKNGIKRYVTNDGKSMPAKWISDNVVLVEKNEESDGIDPWITIGYEKINTINGKTSAIARPIKEDTDENKIKLKVLPNKPDEPGWWKSGAWYEFYYKGKKIFTTPYVISESEWVWKPEILWISEKQFLTVLFTPLNKEKQSSCYFGGGTFELVRVDCTNSDVKIVHKDVHWFPQLTISPDMKLITFLGNTEGTPPYAPDQFFFMDQTCIKKREFNPGSMPYTKKEFNPGRMPYTVTWSPDSKYCIFVTLQPACLYKIDFDEETK